LLAVAIALLTFTIGTVASDEVATATARVDRRGAQLDPVDLWSTGVVRDLARHIRWRGSLESLQEHLHVVQSPGTGSLQLSASAVGDAEAEDVLRGWTSSYVRYRRRLLTQRPNLISNPGFEHGAEGWEAYNGNGGPTPSLARTARPQNVDSGRYALAVTADNPERRARLKLVWTQDVVPVQPRERYLVRATVSGAASRREPILLGFRVTPQQAVTNAGMRRIGRGFEKTNSVDRWLMEGGFTVPLGVSGVQVAIWQMMAPLSVHRFAVDAVALRLRYVPPAAISRRIDAISRSLVVGAPADQRLIARSVALSAAAGLAGALLVLLLVPVVRDRQISPAAVDEIRRSAS